MMQKNINQYKGVDIRKEANIRVKKSSESSPVALLVYLLVAIIVGVSVYIYMVS